MLIISHQGNSNQIIMRYHITPTKIAIINKSNNNKFWQGCGEIRTLIHCYWDYRMFQPLRKTIWQFLKKLNIALPHGSAILLLGIYPKELKTYVLTNTCTVMFIAALIILAKKWKKPKYLVTEEWIKCGISIQWNIYYLVIGYIT